MFIHKCPRQFRQSDWTKRKHVGCIDVQWRPVTYAFSAILTNQQVLWVCVKYAVMRHVGMNQSECTRFLNVGFVRFFLALFEIMKTKSRWPFMNGNKCLTLGLDCSSGSWPRAIKDLAFGKDSSITQFLLVERWLQTIFGCMGTYVLNEETMQGRKHKNSIHNVQMDCTRHWNRGGPRPQMVSPFWLYHWVQRDKLTHSLKWLYFIHSFSDSMMCIAVYGKAEP